MPKSVRSLITVAMLVAGVWFTFSVPLGHKTLAGHLDAIGSTPEAEALRKGAQRRLTPALEEVEDRLLGEYVEAPTHLEGPSLEPPPSTARPRARSGGSEGPRSRSGAGFAAWPGHGEEGPEGSVYASTADEAKLPGRR